MRKRSVGFLLVVGGVALTTGVALSMVRTADGTLSGDPAAVENALLASPTTIAPAEQSGEPAATNAPPTTLPVEESTASEPPPSTPPSSTRAAPSITTTSGLESIVIDPRVPTSLTIPTLQVQAPVDPYGIDPNGQMDVPDNVTDVGWYEFGPSPGAGGSAVLAAHVDLASQGPGVFFDLDDLRDGDLVTVGYNDGTTADFRVVASTIYDKDELPLDAIFSRTGPPVLTLITCGGGFSESARSYDSNVVVYAVPVVDDRPVGSSST